MSDFLLELRCEEIPARMQASARAELEKLFRAGLAGLAVGGVTVWSTPRRLVLIARDLPLATEAAREEAKGPRTSAPEQALEGFLRKTGLAKADLVERDGVWFAIAERPGRATADLLAEAIPAIIRGFAWPKSMRWGAASAASDSLRWVRPLSGIVALLGSEVVECSVDGIAAGRVTLGHRFHHPGAITIGGAEDYQEKLRACHVIVDHAEREALIRSGAAAAAETAGLVLVADEGLVVENAGLTEWPVPLLGRFDSEYLAVPPEVIQLTARTNQKYFICRDGAGQLADAFVCTANIAAKNGGASIVAGNRKVLAARLSDARFFWEQDRRKSLADHAGGLSRIVFHEKLGTVADKVARVAKLAEWLASEGIVPGCDPALARQAAELCKADLVTEMVGEFPELQGVIGGYYARAEGLDDAVCDAIRDHYKPVGQGDDVPTAPVTVAVSLADKLDTLAGFFFIDERPTGSKDPFALRRAMLGVLALVLENGLRVSYRELLMHALDGCGPWFQDRCDALLAFAVDRLKVRQREAGVHHDLIDAVFALGGEDDLVRLLARVHALQSFITTPDGANLLAGYKRAANILKKEGWKADEVAIPATGEEDPLAMVDDPGVAEAARQHAELRRAPAHPAEPAEAALIAALAAAEPRAAAAIDAEDFARAMAALSTLRAPIDAFFEGVTVNDPAPAIRSARLVLLDRFRAAVHKVADFSRIDG